MLDIITLLLNMGNRNIAAQLTVGDLPHCSVFGNVNVESARYELND